MTETPQVTLAEALNFTDDDLAANRAGVLSERQRTRLTRTWRRTLWIVIALVIVLGLGATILLFIAERSGSTILSVVGIIVTFANAAILGIGAQSYLSISSDLRSGKITTVSGVVSHTKRVSGRAATYVLKLDGQEVIVSRQVFFAIPDRQAFRLYRAPSSRTLLAGEPE